MKFTLSIWLLIFPFVLASGCRPHGDVHVGADLLTTLRNSEDSLAKHVLVVINTQSADSEKIGSAYVKARKIPHANVILVSVSPDENCDISLYYRAVIEPIKEFIKKDTNSIDYMVVTKGDPLILKNSGYACDAALAAIDKLGPNSAAGDYDMKATPNPYYNASSPFTHARYGIYLVDRLDGYTLDDALALIDHSLKAKPEKGLFFFQESASKTTQSYGELQATMQTASDYLTTHGYDTYAPTQTTFITTDKPLMGYVTWGSNNGPFDEGAYESMHFHPGAIGETYVSTSARTLIGKAEGQSQIGALIHSGITGVKGYVSEPYTIALCRADVLFSHYITGYNLAESFYAASPVIKWKDIVIGDPLCAPYSKG